MSGVLRRDVVQRITAALQHQQVERDPVGGGHLIELLEQGFGKPDRARDVGVLEVFL